MESTDAQHAPDDYAEMLRRIEVAHEQDVVEQALTAARDRLCMDAAYITTIDPRVQMIDALVGNSSALGLSEGLVVPIEQTYCRNMLSGAMPNIVPDTRAEPAVRDLIATRTIGAYVGVPVTLADGRVHGTLCCASSQPRYGLGGEELRFMRVLAGIIASRVDQAEGDVARLLARRRPA
ncbi:MAG TPA: GAF domain-containing protein [Solirubrobacteraceae bacterium]|nr:GAF domain-containing protein [Solirubrobacteraceae bacterium]